MEFKRHWVNTEMFILLTLIWRMNSFNAVWIICIVIFRYTRIFRILHRYHIVIFADVEWFYSNWSLGEKHKHNVMCLQVTGKNWFVCILMCIYFSTTDAAYPNRDGNSNNPVYSGWSLHPNHEWWGNHHDANTETGNSGCQTGSH